MCWRSEPDQGANSRQQSEVWRLGFGLMFSFVMAEWMAKALTRTGEEDLFVAWPGGLKSHRVEKSSSSQVKKSSSLQVGKSVCCQSFWSRCLVGWKCCWVVGGDDCLGGWQGWWDCVREGRAVGERAAGERNAVEWLAAQRYARRRARSEGWQTERLRDEAGGWHMFLTQGLLSGGRRG